MNNTLIRRDFSADNFRKDWSYMARNSTYRAVTKAGFNKRTFPRLEDIMFITEPEAAAIYTARYFDELNEQFLKVRGLIA
jgi:hypothetical protein